MGPLAQLQHYFQRSGIRRQAGIWKPGGSLPRHKRYSQRWIHYGRRQLHVHDKRNPGAGSGYSRQPWCWLCRMAAETQNALSLFRQYIDFQGRKNRHTRFSRPFFVRRYPRAQLSQTRRGSIRPHTSSETTATHRTTATQEWGMCRFALLSPRRLSYIPLRGGCYPGACLGM